MIANLLRLTSLIFVALLFVCACSSAPTLLTKSATPPQGVDFSGYWTLRPGHADMRLPRGEGQLGPIIRTKRSARRSRDDVPVQVFLENGEDLKVTQTLYGIFISYDRAVVEEFTFGENRDIKLGPIEARRVAGWEGDTFVVETMDERRNRMIEQWRYEPSDDTLMRRVRIVRNDKESLNLQQVFDRRT